MHKRILIVAGEPSGDLHGAGLVRALNDSRQDLEFFGAGGRRMNEAGVRLLYDTVSFCAVGLVDVLLRYPKLKHVFNLLLAAARPSASPALLSRRRGRPRGERERPDLAILIDYPSFNLRLAEKLKKLNIPIVYYISPQVWAWGKKRIRLIKRLVRKMLVLFKFEEAIYKREGIDVEFVGHPLLDILEPYPKMPPAENTIALLPGSRAPEVKRLLPVMIKAACLIREKLPEARFIVSKVANLDAPLYAPAREFEIVEDSPYECIMRSSLALVASGTATLECAILGRPMIIVYKVSPLTWFVGRRVVEIPYMGLVNVVAGKRIVPELLQGEATPEKIAAATLELLSSPQRLKETQNELAQLRGELGSPGASARAARCVSELLRS